MEQSCNCQDKAKISTKVEFGCENCNKVIEKFTIKKPLRLAGLAAVIAYGGSQFIDYAITDNRYPMKVEYSLLDACISSEKKPLDFNSYGDKKQKCLCALEDTMNEISYIRYKVDRKGFVAAYKKNARMCK